LLIECHTPPVCAGRKDYTCKFGCDTKNIHKIRLNNHRSRGCPQHVDGNGTPIKEKMYPNLLERDTVDRLQASANAETLLQEYLPGEDHVPEKRRLSRVELEPKKSHRESASTAPASEEVSDQPPDFMELSDRYFSECEDYVHRRGIALYTTGLPVGV
jgi:hypothetical protein